MADVETEDEGCLPLTCVPAYTHESDQNGTSQEGNDLKWQQVCRNTDQNRVSCDGEKVKVQPENVVPMFPTVKLSNNPKYAHFFEPMVLPAQPLSCGRVCEVKCMNFG
jgi:hypothetical protein